jgi:SM-20-related protein
VALGANEKRYNRCMLAKYSAQSLQQQLNMISEHGFCVRDDFISPRIVSALASEVNALSLASKMHAAATGREQKTVNKQLRGDSVYWLEPSAASPAQQEYFTQMEALRMAFNQQLYLGLHRLESHLALYPIGTGYKKHLDRFRAEQNQQAQRQISSILYLNEAWREADGGKLRLYLNADSTDADTANLESPVLAQQYLDISPIGGRLVMFLSDSFYHEVLPTFKQRASLTGWFLTR